MDLLCATNKHFLKYAMPWSLQRQGRQQVREKRKGLTQEQKDIVRDAHAEHSLGRTVLEGVYEDLQLMKSKQADGSDVSEDIAAVSVAIETTKKKPSKPLVLYRQLETLSEVLKRDRVKALAKERTGEDLDAKLSAHIEKMNAMQQTRATPGGTPEQTAYLHLLNGIAITLARRALKAAKSAAKAKGDASIAQMFTLGHLH